MSMGPHVSPLTAEPIDFFARMYPTELVDLIAEQTNLYASQRGTPGWQDMTTREFEAAL